MAPKGFVYNPLFKYTLISFIESITGTNELHNMQIDQLPTEWLQSSVCSALHQHRRGSWVRIPLEPSDFFRWLNKRPSLIAKIVQISERMTSLFRLKIFLLVTLQNEGWSTGVVHGPGPWRGPWTESTGVIHGPGVHVLYTSGIFIYKMVLTINFIRIAISPTLR